MPNRSGAPRLAPFFALIVLVGLAACERAVVTGEVATWRLEPTPLIAVGDRADADSMVLASVSDARYLPGGGLAIADASANRVMFYDERGREVARAGRRGRGPGEFVGRLALVTLPGDSVAVWDASQARWTRVDARTGGIGTGADSVIAPTVLHAGLMVHSLLPVPPAWVIRTLDARSAASGEIRTGHVDDRGLLWISQDAAQREWQVFADTGAPLASLTLPEDLRALHFERGALVGIASDSTGLEQVVVHRIRMGAIPEVDRTPAAPLAIADSARRALQASMRMAVVAQEMNYMTRSAYTLHADSLRFTPVPGTRFKILSADERGWSGVAWYLDSGYTCAMIIGQAVPAGWSEGEVRCAW